MNTLAALRRDLFSIAADGAASRFTLGAGESHGRGVGHGEVLAGLALG